MMMRVVTSLALVAALVAPALAQTGKTNMEILSQKVKADKKLVVASNLKLTDAEGAKFWPVYEAYQKELQTINTRLVAGIKAYADAYAKGPMTDEQSAKLLKEATAIDDAEAKLRSSLVPKVMAVLPATKAVRYLQIENKIRAVLRYEMATGIPLVD